MVEKPIARTLEKHLIIHSHIDNEIKESTGKFLPFSTIAHTMLSSYIVGLRGAYLWKAQINITVLIFVTSMYIKCTSNTFSWRYIEHTRDNESPIIVAKMPCLVAQSLPTYSTSLNKFYFQFKCLLFSHQIFIATLNRIKQL